MQNFGGQLKCIMGDVQVSDAWLSEVETAKFLTKIEWKKTLLDGQSICKIKTPVYILELCQEIG